MAAGRAFLDAEGMWYGGDLPVQIAGLRARAAIVMPGQTKAVPGAPGQKALLLVVAL